MSVTLTAVAPDGVHPIEIIETTTVEELKQKVGLEMDCSSEEVELVYGGAELTDTDNVMEYGVCDGDEIEVLPSKKIMAQSFLRARSIAMTPKNLVTGIRMEAEHVRQLIDSGMDLDCIHHGKTPLCTALSCGNITAARHLIQKKCDIPETVYDVSISYHQLESVRLLLDSGIEPVPLGLGVTPLQQALSENQPQIAKLLLSRGVAVNTFSSYGSTPLHEAIIGLHKELACRIISLLKDDELSQKGPYFSETPLLCSIRYNQTTVAKELLARNVPTHHTNCTKYDALQLALHFNNVEVVQLLLDKDPKISAETIEKAKAVQNKASSLLFEVIEERKKKEVRRLNSERTCN